MGPHDDDRRSFRRLSLTMLLAVLLHVGIVEAVPRVRATMRRAPTTAQVDLVEVEPLVPAEPEPEPEPEPARPEPVRPEPVVAEQAAQQPTEPPPQAEPQPAEPPPPAQETPVEFDGLVLGGEGSSWSTTQASGQERGALIGTPGAAVTGRSREGTPGGVVGGTGTGAPTLVADADLRRRPVPPSADELNALLQRNYPEEAKRQGISGRARVRAIVGTDGRLRSVRVVRESPAGQGFGGACRRALLDAADWQPAIGPDGQPAATEIPFDCAFDVHQ